MSAASLPAPEDKVAHLIEEMRTIEAQLIDAARHWRGRKHAGSEYELDRLIDLHETTENKLKEAVSARDAAAKEEP